VSATILWEHVAQEFDVPAVARQFPGHLQSVLVLEQERIIIEPTCPCWFSLHKGTGSLEFEGAAIAAASSSPADELRDAGLIAAVYYNRGLALLADGDFAGALTATYQSHRLNPASQAARSNLLAVINNWALHLAAQGQEPRAISMLKLGRQIAPDHQTFQANLDILSN
jgi:tetratricopeptide (TPR) repeat protein